jgi:hypothetical protein
MNLKLTAFIVLSLRKQNKAKCIMQTFKQNDGLLLDATRILTFDSYTKGLWFYISVS